MKRADYWVRINSNKEEKAVQCLLCPHVCKIAKGELGICRVRRNVEGELNLINYGQVTAESLDPIEKKPLKLYMPGQKVFSLGTFGCNLACGFCQNWSIAHGEAPPAKYLSPLEAVEKAAALELSGNIGIAYTYSEPLMWYEYVLDTARLVREKGLKNILVTNGYINPKPLQGLIPYLDAVNLDIKGYTKDYYQQVCKGRIDPVLSSAKLLAQGGIHLEVTTLLVTTLNDSPEEIYQLASWLAAIDESIPLHLTRYFPNYKMELPPTPLDTMYKAEREAKKVLKNVFLGNI